MKKHAYIKEWLLAAAVLGLLTFGCDSPNRDETDSEAGTSQAIIKDNNRLAEPRPAPIGDTATTPEAQQRFGDMKSNVDSTARGLR